MDLQALRLQAVHEDIPWARCFSCIATALGSTEPEVRGAAHMLVVQHGFRTIRRVCYGCSRTDDTLVPDKNFSSRRRSLAQN